MDKTYHALVEGRIFYGGAADVPAMIAQEGVTVVVDLREESTGLAADAPGVEWIRIPLGDNSPEPQDKLFGDAIAQVVRADRAGRKVAFHCGGGKGRTGTVAAGVLVELGLCATLDAAADLAKAIRPVIQIKPEQRAALDALYPDAVGVRATLKGTVMKQIQIYDPALCCSTGVCGVEVDQTLVSAAADIDWAKQNGARIERFNLAQQPLAFAENATVKAFLERSGAEALPLILVDGDVALAGRYPNRAELSRWAGIAPVAQQDVPQSSCCSGGRCC